jgi:hypothetical protein
MASPPHPCAHCGGVQLQILPNMMVDLEVASSVFGRVAKQKISGVFWTFSLVVCTACGCTQMFTSNAAQLAEHVPGAQVHTVEAR